MKINLNRNFLKRSSGISKLLVLTLAVALLAPITALSFEFQSGGIKGSLDSTLSYGLTWRVKDQDPDIIGLANGGNAFSVNGDDGNLNYDKGDLTSNVAKLTSELSLGYSNFGLFLRGTAFYDFENEDGDRARTELRSEALDLVGSDADLLDAYIIGDFDLGNVPLQIRVGDQVVSWGESTFIQNSINAINPVNVSAIRLPGAELKEALVPEGMVWASAGITDNTSLEAFYLYDWEETVIDPPGSYWSTNDFVGDGGSKIMLGFGDVPDSINLGDPFPPAAPVGAVVPRGPTVEASDDGQYGVAMRIYAPNLNDTEFGFYFMNYHSRLPIISANTGSFVGLAVDGNYAASASYFIEYPEDIKLYGVSFNTLLSGSGVALQGEYSYRQDMPLQVDDLELLMAALSPIDPFVFTGPVLPPVFGSNQLGPQAFDSTVHGFKEMDVSQVQMTATNVFGPTFGADQFVLLGEAGLTQVHNMPSKDELRFESAATYVSGNTTLTNVGLSVADVVHGGKPAEPASAFADATSWGYRIVSKMDFNNAIGAVTLSPRIAWKHDVQGNSPGPGGNFLEDRKAITFGLGANYLNSWTADLSYTDFFGAGRYNLINDRDFVALNIKYSF